VKLSFFADYLIINKSHQLFLDRRESTCIYKQLNDVVPVEHTGKFGRNCSFCSIVKGCCGSHMYMGTSCR